jgi:hypothetical protein
MGLRDRLERKAAELGQGVLTAAPEYVQRAEDGYRGFREMWGDDDRPLTIEAFLLALTQAVRDDDPDDFRSHRDLYVKARKRRRRLGLMCFGAGPFAGVANRVADLYCEIATLCDVASIHDLVLSDQQVAAQMLVLWGITDDLPGAERAMAGEEPGVASILGGRLARETELQMPAELTKTSVAKLLWDVHQLDVTDTVMRAKKGATTGSVRVVAFTGHRVKKVIKRSEIQLGVRQ